MRTHWRIPKTAPILCRRAEKQSKDDDSLGKFKNWVMPSLFFQFLVAYAPVYSKLADTGKLSRKYRAGYPSLVSVVGFFGAS